MQYLLCLACLVSLAGAITVELDASARAQTLVRKQTKHSQRGDLRPPPFPTTASTCDGKNLDDRCNESDPCASSSCFGAYHGCGAGGTKGYKRCAIQDDGSCSTSNVTCWLKCPGFFVSEIQLQNLSAVQPHDCSQLDNVTCQESYVALAEPGYVGMKCRLRADNVCIADGRCAVQDPPDSFGPSSAVLNAALETSTAR